MSDRESKNRVLAEFVGVYVGPCQFSGTCRINRCVSKDGEYVHEPPDFYKDESANALLLDKLLSLGLRVCMEPSETHKDEITLLCPYFLGGGGTMFRYDRKTAICEAAYYQYVMYRREMK